MTITIWYPINKQQTMIPDNDKKLYKLNMTKNYKNDTIKISTFINILNTPKYLGDNDIWIYKLTNGTNRKTTKKRIAKHLENDSSEQFSTYETNNLDISQVCPFERAWLEHILSVRRKSKTRVVLCVIYVQCQTKRWNLWYISCVYKRLPWKYGYTFWVSEGSLQHDKWCVVRKI